METLIDKDMSELRNKYKFDYTIDTPYENDKANNINEQFFLNLYSILGNFNFEEKKKKLIDKIQKKKTFLKHDDFQFYENKINVIEEMYIKLRHQISISYKDYFLLINKFDGSYEENEKKPGVLFTYNKIIIDILGEISDKCINFENQLITINNLINEINNSLI